ncbi:MAG TPA: glycosyltransferase family 39 protein [Thermoleophilaceae bacterium]|nr:glycosyltransferase family 39 protein [Thermoleophilaceae bacterium]
MLVAAAALRLWHIDSVGFNSDEAVYSGQGAAIANEPELGDLFPVFRAHPLLVQTFLSLGWRLGLDTGFERLVSVAAGVATVYLVYELGRQLYGRRTGLIAALLLALMPYHVLVSRQVLLDGPMTMLATLTLLLLVRFVMTGRPAWLYATGAAMGLTFLAKETSIVLLLAIYAFLALTPELRVRLRDLAISTGVMALVMAPFPLSIFLTGRSGTGESYLTWQLFRRPNHDWLFYASNVPEVLGPLVLVAALAGLVLLRRPGSWPERLLLCWIAVPVLFFELWPVKGFQYLLPIVAPVAVLAARPLVGRRTRPVLAVVCVSLLAVTIGRVAATEQRTMLAGAGGVPAGREVGEWIDAHVPRGATFMTIGPSMANLVQFYGRREAYGLSVSPNPLNRNPSYEPIPNPDEALRTGDIQYVVWDTFSASRSRGFSDRLLAYAERYDARAVHVETLPARTPGGHTARRPAIVVYEVRP